MNNIVINYIIEKEIKNETLQEIIKELSLVKNLSVFFHDFSIDKSIKNILDDYKLENVIVNEYPYEDHDNVEKFTIDNMENIKTSVAFAVLKQNIIINHEIINSIDFGILAEGDYGFLYTDYNIGNIRCYMQSNKPGLNLNVPSIFWSLQKTLDHKQESNVFNEVYRSYMGLHIPRSGFKIVY